MEEKNYMDNVNENQYENLNKGSSNYNSSNQENGGGKNSDTVPGKGAAVAAMVLGIVSIVFWFFGAGAFVGLITGIIGLICSSSAKKAGYSGGMQTAGFVCSLIGLVGSALAFVACVACVGALGTAGMLDAL